MQVFEMGARRFTAVGLQIGALLTPRRMDIAELRRNWKSKVFKPTIREKEEELPRGSAIECNRSNTPRGMCTYICVDIVWTSLVYLLCIFGYLWYISLTNLQEK
jgi:hypothetical protein